MSQKNSEAKTNEPLIEKEIIKPSDISDKDSEKKPAKGVSYYKLQFSFIGGIDYFFFIVGIIAALTMGAMMPLFSILFGGTINTFNPSTTTSLKELMKPLISQYLIIGGISIFFGMVFHSTWNFIGKKLIKEMKKEYFMAILGQDLAYFDTAKTFDFASKFQTEIKTVDNALGVKVGHVYQALIGFIVSFSVGFYYSWKLSLVLCALLPLVSIAGIFAFGNMKKLTKKSVESYSEAGGIAEEIVTQIKTVFTYGNFDWEKKRFEEKIELSYSKGVSLGLLFSFSMSIFMFIIFSTYCAAFWYGGYLIAAKEINPRTGKPFAGGDVIVVFFSVIFGGMQLSQIGPSVSGLNAACAAAGSLFELKEKAILNKSKVASLIAPDKAIKVDTLKGKIEFSNVTFAYPSKEKETVIRNVNLTAECGKTIAIVGESGAGKSTIVNLIERLYDTESGEIKIDDINIKEVDIYELRSMIGYVSQEPVLFNDTIKENIIFGRENITDEMINEALKDSYAYEFVKEKGLDYNVGVKGSKLSGGQKQRIAIARAILTKPKILILDEATSALDNKSEKVVKSTLNRICQNVTTIVIAHRLSTIINSDKIYVLAKEKGEKGSTIIEEGTHQELLDKNGYYAELIKNQIGIVDEADKNEHNDSLIDTNLLSEKETDNLINTKEEEKKEEDIQKEKKEEMEQLKKYQSQFMSIIKNFKGLLVIAIIFSLIAGSIQPMYGFLMSEGINSLSDISDPYGKGKQVGIYFLLYATCNMFIIFFQYLSFRIIGERIAKILRLKTFDKYLELDASFYDISENNPGSLLSKLSTDTTNLNGIALSTFCSTTQSISTVLIGIIGGFIYNWKLSLVNLAFMPVMISFHAVLFKIMTSFARTDDKVNLKVGSMISECVNNTVTIFSYNMQRHLKEKQASIVDWGFDQIKRKIFISSFFFGCSQGILFFIYATLFYLGSYLVDNGSLKIPDMFKAIFILLFASMGVGMAQVYVGDMTKAKESLLNLYKVINTEPKIDISKKEDSIVPTEIKGHIKFTNVTFAFPSKPDIRVLDNVSFEVNPGQCVAFVGTSGSGKSTIVQLIERFYDIDSGSIEIDDIDIKKYDIIALRKFIGVVLQEPVIFQRNVKENIRYGNLEATDEMVLEVAKQARIEQYVNEENYDKEKVSGGEKQRIAIARAMLKKPSILLLDEATSALDKENEEKVQEHLNECMVGRTSIVVAHRLSTVEKCDKIFLIEEGKIIEQGTHQELIELQGKYYKLYIAGQGKTNTLIKE